MKDCLDSTAAWLIPDTIACGQCKTAIIVIFSRLGDRLHAAYDRDESVREVRNIVLIPIIRGIASKRICIVRVYQREAAVARRYEKASVRENDGIVGQREISVVRAPNAKASFN